ncbi:hypothetical protein D3C79_1053760 [compost metagenome]
MAAVSTLSTVSAEPTLSSLSRLPVAAVAPLTTNSVRCVVVALRLVVMELSRPMPPAVTRTW